MHRGEKRLRPGDANVEQQPKAQRRHVESAPAPDPWLIPSITRCFACHQLECRCRHHVDPAVRRQRLELLERNTPYAKAKALRLTEEIQREERRARRSIELQDSTLRSQIEASSIWLRSSCTLWSAEVFARDQVVSLRRLQLDQIGLSMDQERSLLTCCLHESQSRGAVAAVEECDRLRFVQWMTSAKDLYRICLLESFRREEWVMKEASQREGMLELAAKAAHGLHSWALSVSKLGTEWSMSRDQLYLTWVSEMESLAARWERAKETLQRHQEQRQHVLQVCVQRGTQIEQEESAARSHMQQAKETWELRYGQKLMEDATEREECFRMEAANRSECLAAADRMIEQILSQRQQERTWILETQRYFISRQGELWSSHVAQRDRCQREESEAFLQLIQLGQRDQLSMMRRHEEKRAHCAVLVAQCSEIHANLIQHEEEERRGLIALFVDMREHILHRLHSEKNARDQCESDEAEFRKVLSDEERNSFSQLYTRRGASERDAVRLHESRESDRISLQVEETKARHQLANSEETLRERLLCRYLRFIEEEQWLCCRVGSLLDAQGHAYCSLQETEASQWDGILSLWSQTVKLYHHSQTLSSLWKVETDEAHARSLIQQEEGRVHIDQLKDLAALHRQVLQFSRHQDALKEVAMDEPHLRHQVSETQRSCWEELMNEFASALAAVEAHQQPECRLLESLTKEVYHIDSSVSLRYDQLSYLTAYSERCNQQRAQLAGELNRSQQAAEHATKKRQRVEDLLDGKREQRDLYAIKCKRDQEELTAVEKRVREDRKRFKVELEQESTFLLAVERELEIESKAVDQLKGSLSKTSSY